jgi:peptidyl-prolyl cis-trans isomerase D
MQFASLNSLTRPDTKYYREEELSPELAAIAFGNRTGEMNGPTLDGDNYTVSRVSDVRMMPDSVGARHILLPATNAAVADSIATAIRGGKSIFELAPSYTMDQTVDLGVFPPDMMVEPFANAVIDARVGQVLVVETQYGTHVVEVTSKTPMVRKAQIATISYSVEPSEVTRQAAYNEAREFLTVAAGSKENFDAAVTQTGASRRVATIASGDRDVRGLTDSRELVQWSFNTKPGTVSAILDIDEDYVVAVLTGAKEPGFTKVTEAAPNIASQLRRDKKAEMLKEQIAGKSFDEVAAMEGAKSGVLENLKVSAFYVPELGVEPAVIGAVENVEAGKVSKPVKGISGIYLVAVDSMEQTGEATFESKKVQMEAMSEGSIMQRVAQSMTEGVEIIDNRSKFF